MNLLSIPLLPLAHGAHLPLPAYATLHAAGLDLLAAMAAPVTLAPLERTLIPTGIAIALPPGYEAQLRPRSGLALKHGLTLLNSPGTIDADYRGEIKVLMINLSHEPYHITPGMRIAQMVIAPVARVEWEVTDALEPTARAEGGFGSTGHETAFEAGQKTTEETLAL